MNSKDFLHITLFLSKLIFSNIVNMFVSRTIRKIYSYVLMEITFFDFLPYHKYGNVYRFVDLRGCQK